MQSDVTTAVILQFNLTKNYEHNAWFVPRPYFIYINLSFLTPVKIVTISPQAHTKQSGTLNKFI